MRWLPVAFLVNAAFTKTCRGLELITHTLRVRKLNHYITAPQRKIYWYKIWYYISNSESTFCLNRLQELYQSRRKYFRCVATLVASLFLDCMSMQANPGTIYEDVSAVHVNQPSQASHSGTTFNSHFQKCSRDSICNFITRNRTSGEFKMHPSEKYFPLNSPILQVWQKKESNLTFE